ncbi:hypothetical protein HN51_027502, partial [Arachis hypogaea]
MQFWNKSKICCLLRHGLELTSEDWEFKLAATFLRRMSVARLARSSLSSLEPKKKGLVGTRCERPWETSASGRPWLGS